MATWKFSDIVNMDPDQVFDLLEEIQEIPSDDESLIEDLEEVMNDELPMPDAPNNDENVFDIANMDIIIENNDAIPNPELDWDSDDDIPLARRPDVFLPDYWTNDVFNITVPSAFTESTGPDLPDEVDRKAHKWWHRIFFYFVDASIFNAFVLIQQRSNCKSLTLKQFRTSVARGLIGIVEPTKRGRSSSGRPANNFKKVVLYEVRYSNAAHMPERSTSVRCGKCSTLRDAHRTIWKCSTCQVGLCLNKDRNCFALFHMR